MNHLSGTPLYVHINIPDVNVMRWLWNTIGWDKTEHPVSFYWHYIGQIYGGDFTKFCDLLRIYKL
jgi:hypothetical protein